MESPAEHFQQSVLDENKELDLSKLDQVFKVFIFHVKTLQIGLYHPDDFDSLILNQKTRQPIMFQYDGISWMGIIKKHKWANCLDDNNLWNTISYKIPNTEFSYTNHIQKDENDLKDDALREMEASVAFSFEYFGNEDIDLKIFYRAQRNRLTIQARCESMKANLEITFLIMDPVDNVTTKWYTREEMLGLLRK